MLCLTDLRFQNGQSGSGCLPTGALTEIELQFIESSGEAIGGTDDRFGHRTAENGHSSTSHG